MDIDQSFIFKTDAVPNEDRIWNRNIAPLLNEAAANVRQICQYGFTEMLNNAITHSGSTEIKISVSANDLEITFDIIDNGIGIFFKIQNDLDLDDPRDSILELTKGKYTSEPENHSGEGIFFTSRIFDRFSIRSGRLLFLAGKDGDRLLEEPENQTAGTIVSMTVRKDTALLVGDVFNEFSDPDNNPSFYKTIIPLKLMEHDGDLLMSRSQAKRLISRFNLFREVVLDFSGIEFIGQGFADEVFRVFANTDSNVKLLPINCAKDVENMIRHVGWRF
jgi:anti-sigma regulatory factor (Ser/Thr protein kinase)